MDGEFKHFKKSAPICFLNPVSTGGGGGGYYREFWIGVYREVS